MEAQRERAFECVCLCVCVDVKEKRQPDKCALGIFRQKLDTHTRTHTHTRARTHRACIHTRAHTPFLNVVEHVCITLRRARKVRTSSCLFFSVLPLWMRCIYAKQMVYTLFYFACVCACVCVCVCVRKSTARRESKKRGPSHCVSRVRGRQPFAAEGTRNETRRRR